MLWAVREGELVVRCRDNLGVGRFSNGLDLAILMIWISHGVLVFWGFLLDMARWIRQAHGVLGATEGASSQSLDMSDCLIAKDIFQILNL